MEGQAKNADARYAKIVEEAAQAEGNFCVHIASLESSLKAGNNCIERSEKSCGNKAAGDGEGPVD